VRALLRPLPRRGRAERDFVIYDSSDQKAVVVRALRELATTIGSFHPSHHVGHQR